MTIGQVAQLTGLPVYGARHGGAGSVSND